MASGHGNTSNTWDLASEPTPLQASHTMTYASMTSIPFTEKTPSADWLSSFFSDDASDGLHPANALIASRQTQEDFETYWANDISNDTDGNFGHNFSTMSDNFTWPTPVPTLDAGASLWDPIRSVSNESLAIANDDEDFGQPIDIQQPRTLDSTDSTMLSSFSTGPPPWFEGLDPSLYVPLSGHNDAYHQGSIGPRLKSAKPIARRRKSLGFMRPSLDSHRPRQLLVASPDRSGMSKQLGHMQSGSSKDSRPRRKNPKQKQAAASGECEGHARKCLYCPKVFERNSDTSRHVGESHVPRRIQCEIGLVRKCPANGCEYQYLRRRIEAIKSHLKKEHEKWYDELWAEIPDGTLRDEQGQRACDVIKKASTWALEHPTEAAMTRNSDLSKTAGKCHRFGNPSTMDGSRKTADGGDYHCDSELEFSKQLGSIHEHQRPGEAGRMHIDNEDVNNSSTLNKEIHSNDLDLSDFDFATMSSNFWSRSVEAFPSTDGMESGGFGFEVGSNDV